MEKKSEGSATIMQEELPTLSVIQQKITAARSEHPDSIVVYFVKHKTASESLPKPKTPLMLFNKEIRVEEVFYALYQQIQVKGLSFYVLKTQSKGMVSYYSLKPGQTIGQVFDQYSYNNYLALIYNQGALKRWKFTPTQIRVFRIAFMIGMIWLITNLYPLVENQLYPKSHPSSLPSNYQES